MIGSGMAALCAPWIVRCRLHRLSCDPADTGRITLFWKGTVMDNRLRKDYTVLTSSCDAEGLLGLRNIFDICMDLAAEHAAELGVGYYDMLDKRCFWVAVRTRVRIYERPKLGSHITTETWPGKPGRAKSDRYYRLSADGRVLVEGRTEWGVQDLDTGAVRRTDSYGYPLELVHCEDRVCAEPFTRFRQQAPEEDEFVQTCRVRSMDIDVGRHMNNVAYIRMILNTFTVRELSRMNIRELEISYRQACYEGEELSIYRCREEDGWFFQVQKEDGETAVHARVLLQ